MLKTLNTSSTVLYHHLTTKLLSLSKQTHPKLQLSVSFLTTRILSPNVDNWKKLGRCLHYLCDTKDIPQVLSSNGTGVIHWWVNASFAVHPDCAVTQVLQCLWDKDVFIWLVDGNNSTLKAPQKLNLLGLMMLCHWYFGHVYSCKGGVSPSWTMLYTNTIKAHSSREKLWFLLGQVLVILLLLVDWDNVYINVSISHLDYGCLLWFSEMMALMRKQVDCCWLVLKLLCCGNGQHPLLIVAMIVGGDRHWVLLGKVTQPEKTGLIVVCHSCRCVSHYCCHVFNKPR